MEVVYTKAITKDVRKIKNPKLIESFKECIVSLESATDLTEITAVKKLSKHRSAFRIRLGGYRLGFFRRGDTIILACLAKRADIYKSFPCEIVGR